MNTIDVSIIISTKNEEKNIAGCLQSVKNQTFPQERMETIVVDNHSTDNTVEIARQFADAVYTCGPERSAQRNFGIEKGRGNYVLFLDADMILSENVIRECFDKCENEGHAALYIPEKIIGEGFWIKIRDFERSFYNATCIDCVRFVNRGKFQKIGGFDLTLTGPEDWDFDRRIGETGSLAIINSPLYHNEGEFSLGRYLKKKAYYSGTFGKYAEKWGRKDPLVKKQLGIWYRFFGVFIENGGWIRLIKHPILTAGVYFLRFMVGIQYIFSKSKNGEKK